jgi:hypothetical protein
VQAVEHELPLVEPNVALDRVAPVERDPNVADVGVQREEVAVPRRAVVPARRERHPFDPVGRAEVRLDPFAVAGSARALVPGGAEVAVERLLGAVRMDGVADEARRTHGLRPQCTRRLGEVLVRRLWLFWAERRSLILSGGGRL